MKLVVVDIDGTLSDFRWRERFVDDKELYYELAERDFPHKDIGELVWMLAKSYNIIICTGRKQKDMKMTADWLENQGIPFNELIMRPDGDDRPDHVAKIAAFEKRYQLSDIFFVLEDRQSVVDAWREKGVRVLQVDNYQR